MIDDIVFGLWFFLPAGLANTAPVLAAKIPALDSLNIPLDGNKTFRGKRILGSHKTLRGLVAGILIGVVTATIQLAIYNRSGYLQTASPVDYNTLNPVFWGSLLAFGALGGDALKSFFKRQFNVQPGSSWFPFDQTDYILGGLVVTLPFITISVWQYIIILIVWFILHPISTGIGYILRLKDSPI